MVGFVRIASALVYRNSVLAVLKAHVVLIFAGTTIAGIHELEKMGFRAALMNAVLAAAERGEKLSKY